MPSKSFTLIFNGAFLNNPRPAHVRNQTLSHRPGRRLRAFQRENVFLERVWLTIKYDEVYLQAYACVSKA